MLPPVPVIVTVALPLPAVIAAMSAMPLASVTLPGMTTLTATGAVFAAFVFCASTAKALVDVTLKPSVALPRLTVAPAPVPVTLAMTASKRPVALPRTVTVSAALTVVALIAGPPVPTLLPAKVALMEPPVLVRSTPSVTKPVIVPPVCVSTMLPVAVTLRPMLPVTEAWLTIVTLPTMSPPMSWTRIPTLPPVTVLAVVMVSFDPPPTSIPYVPPRTWAPAKLALLPVLSTIEPFGPVAMKMPTALPKPKSGVRPTMPPDGAVVVSTMKLMAPFTTFGSAMYTPLMPTEEPPPGPGAIGSSVTARLPLGSAAWYSRPPNPPTQVSVVFGVGGNPPGPSPALGGGVQTPATATPGATVAPIRPPAPASSEVANMLVASSEARPRTAAFVVLLGMVSPQATRPRRNPRFERRDTSLAYVVNCEGDAKSPHPLFRLSNVLKRARGDS